MKSRNGLVGLVAALFSSSALLVLSGHSPTVQSAQLIASDDSHPDAVPAEFRGCESAQTCRFQIESSIPLTESIYVVLPNGVLAGMDKDARGIAVRNRLNFLLSNMIHQHKRIELEDLRKLENGTYAATVKVNGMDVRADPILKDLVEISKK